MDLLHRKLVDLFNSGDTCLGVCVSTDDFCRSDCIDYCFSRCPNRIPFPPAPSHHTLPKRFLAAALVLGITVTSLICLTIYYKFYSGPCFRRRRRAEEDGRNQISEEFIDQDHGPVLDHPIWYINTVGLQPSVINSINVCKYRKGDGLVEGTDCSVCLCEFQEDETLRLLPKCSHAFHIPCIDTWLRSHTNCPLCRSPIVAPNQEPEASSSGGAGGGEETRIGVSERREESTESGDGEMRIQIEEKDDSDLQEEDSRRKRSEAEGGIQPLRRSISLYSLSAFKISQALAGVHLTDRDSVKESEFSAEIAAKRIGSNQGLIRFMATSSIGRSLQIGPSSLKRSFSCGGKLFLQRHSSSSVLPL